jgi:hypothetical protein
MSFAEWIYNKIDSIFGEDLAVAAVAVVAAVVAGAVAGAAVVAGAVAGAAGAAGAAAVAAGAGAVAAVVTVAAGAAAVAAGAGAVAAITFFLTFYGVTYFPEIIPFLITTLILTEIFFWTTKRKPEKKENTFNFTLKTKALYFVESAFWIIQANGAYHGIPILVEWLGLNQETISNGLYGLGALLIIIVIAFTWIKINESKFKRKKK